MENNKQKCIIFCRVSSKEQEETGYSLPAQEKYLKEYCYKKELKIEKVFKNFALAKIYKEEDENNEEDESEDEENNGGDE